MANTKKNKKVRKIIVFSTIVVGLISLSLVAVFKKRQVAVTVQTEKVTRRNITELVVANGKIQPVVQVVISPEVAGEIVDLPVKEGQQVKKGDLLIQIKPDNYQASRNSAEASYKSAVAGKSMAHAELEKAQIEFKRNQELFKGNLVSETVFQEFKTAYEVAKLRYENAVHLVDQAKFGLDKAVDDLTKTTIISPIAGTVTRLRSQLGERVLGTSFNMGTEIMTIADLHKMEARVDIGEIDVVLIENGQNARLEVDAFKDRKFNGVVTEIANASKGSSASMMGGGGGGQQQEATKFEVKIRIQEKEVFRPGMSVTAEIETRSRTNVLTVPIQSVTTRLPKKPPTGKKSGAKSEAGKPAGSSPDMSSTTTNSSTPSAGAGTNTTKSASSKKSGEPPKPVEVVFVANSDLVKMVPIKRGISDDNYMEITEGLHEGDEVISGGYKAISRDLEDEKKIKRGEPGEKSDKEKK
jgi:HlyD family secretion protein